MVLFLYWYILNYDKYLQNLYNPKFQKGLALIKNEAAKKGII